MTSARRPPHPRSWGYRLWAVAIVMVGVWLLGDNLHWWLVPEWFNTWPVLVLLGGAVLALLGWPVPSTTLPEFTIERGTSTSARLQVNAGTADVNLSASPHAEALATGRFPSFAKPNLITHAARAHLRFDQRSAWLFNATPWQIDVAPNVAWAMVLDSSLGDFTLNLRDVSLTSLALRSWAGDVELTLPASGTVTIHLTLGQLRVHVPEGRAVQCTLTAGWLADIVIDRARFIRTAPNVWATPNFSEATERCNLIVVVGAGEMVIGN